MELNGNTLLCYVKAILVILQRLKNGTQWEHTVVLCKGYFGNFAKVEQRK
jgi:hypothetical protein